MRRMLYAIAFLTLVSGVHAQTTSTNPLQLPKYEQFAGAELSAEWTQSVSEDSTMTISDRWLGFEAKTTASQCHVRSKLGTDNITLIANVRYLGSIYLIWNDRNWCGAGKVSPTPFGRFYTTISSNGAIQKLDHRGINAGAPQFIRIQLGEKAVRFDYSFDRKTWHFLNATERPVGFDGAPQCAALGKYYDNAGAAITGTAPGTAAQSGHWNTCFFGDFSIEHTENSANDLSPADISAIARMKESDPLGKELLARKEDPTFDSVASFYPGMQRPREVVGVPEHPVDIGINHRGEFDNSPWAPPLGWVEVGEPPVRLNDAEQPITRRLLEGYLPVLTLNARVKGFQLEQTAFGWSEGGSLENDLYCYVHFTARNDDKTSVGSAKLVFDEGKQRKELKSAKPGEWFFRFKHPNIGSAETISDDEFARKLGECTKVWTSRVKAAERFTIPDKRVAEAYRAWVVYSLLNTDTVNGQIECRDGSGFYESVFGYSMALHTMALDELGLKEDVEARLASQLHNQSAEGLYVAECGLPDQGCLMTALGRHYLMTHDNDWLKRIAPKYANACDWVVKMRATAPKEGLTRGLIKFRPYNDYPQPVYNYLGNSYCCLGLELAGQILGNAGMKAEAERFATEGARFRKDILDSMKASAFEKDGMRILPIEPDSQRLLKLSDYRGGDYYGLVAGSMMESDFLSADGEPAELMIGMLERKKGLILGLCEFMEGIDHAYTYGYLLKQLERDDARKVLLGFWSMLAYGMTRDTYSPVEVTYLVLGENHYTLPHLYSCTQQLRLLRNMLVHEEGKTLWLGKAVPREWLAPGKRLAVDQAPTLFGKVSYRIDVQADKTMKVHIEPPLRQAPDELKVRLRNSSYSNIAEAKLADGTKCATEKDVITLKAPKQGMDLVVKFEK